jgi:acyl carrier protein
MVEVKARVREFITRNFYVPSGDTLADDDSLLQQGIVDSTGVLEVIAFLEEAFEVSVDDAEIIPENLDTLARISDFVVRKREG